MKGHELHVMKHTELRGRGGGGGALSALFCRLRESQCMAPTEHITWSLCTLKTGCRQTQYRGAGVHKMVCVMTRQPIGQCIGGSVCDHIQACHQHSPFFLTRSSCSSINCRRTHTLTPSAYSSLPSVGLYATSYCAIPHVHLSQSLDSWLQ